ncbi:hypothetical protein [Streptomyces sp. NPDC051569]|uniref:hypothetical protein n=1 Tax=Streptomyces sp. NPDC051569 TaxID=3365661 RepID=UPI0037AF52E8
MRITGMFTGTLLAGALLLGAAGGAEADSTPSPSATSTDTTDSAAGPTEAGTSFRTATAFRPGQRATAGASTGDYLYWVFPVDAGQRPTVTAKVTLPESATRKGAATWQVDVYDGLRRRQPCVYGAQTRAVAADAATVELRCTLRVVRSWAEPWADDPLPGSYYVRLTVVNAQEEDLGLPVRTEIEATTANAGGAHAVGGTLATPLVPGATAASAEEDAPGDAAASAPEDGWSSGWWTDRWIWTAAGGILGALAAIAGYSLARPSRRPVGPPPGF